MYFSIRKKLLLAFSLSILVPLILTFVLLGIQIRKASVAGFHAGAAKELGHIQAAMEIFMENASNTAIMLSRQADVRKIDTQLSDYTQTRQAKGPKDMSLSDLENRIREFFKLVEASSPHIVEVFLGTRWGGFTYAGDDALPAGYDPRSRPWYRTAIASPDTVTLTPAYMSTTGEPVISLMSGIRTDANELAGIAGLDVSLGVLTSLIQKSRMGETGYVMLIQGDGTLLANPRKPDTNFKKIADTGIPALRVLGDMTSGSLALDMDGKAWLAQVHTIPGLGWKLVGVIERDEVMEGFRTMMRLMGLIGLVVFAVFMALAYLMALSLSTPIRKATLMLKDVAEGEGDLTRKLEAPSRDEIGEMATGFNTFIEKVRDIVSQVIAKAGLVNQSSQQLMGIAGEMDKKVEETARRAQTVASAVEEVNTGFTAVAAAMEEANQNTNMVATASEEMSATITEIARNTENARSVAEQAVQEARNATRSMDVLGEAADAIGKVTATISEISEQTNLLALNATIEAARAGESGKGFAVVANEIKELARQTATATEDIKKRITDIQGSTHSTIAQIRSIDKIILEINNIITTIAAAIEEQSVATREIASNVGEASRGLQEVTSNVAESSGVMGGITRDVAGVSSATVTMKASSSDVARNAQALKDLAQELQHLLGRFRT